MMRDLLGRFPQLDAVFTINDPSALGAVSVLESADRIKGVAVVTVDGSTEAIKAVKAGKLLSTSAQFPKEMNEIVGEAVVVIDQGQHGLVLRPAPS